jgi:hypothetical protein
MPRIIAIMVFLLLAAEHDPTYHQLVPRPMAIVEDGLFTFKIVKVPLWTCVTIVTLLVLGTGPWPRRRARPMDLAMLASLACGGVWIALGMARGGGLQDCAFQTLAHLDGLVFAFIIMAVMRKPHHYGMILEAIVAAAMYRAVMAIIVFVFVVRHLPPDKVPEFMTDQDDSALFVPGLMIVLVGAVERATKDARRLAWILAPILLVAIYLNNRRIAWVSLVFALAAAYAVFPKGAGKRRVHRAAAVAIPLFAVYAAVGWDRPEPVFKPLAALSSVSSQENSSTRSRDYENDGLVFTLAQTNAAIGTGFGQEYTETNTSLNARRAFPQYRLVPHNSVLGLLTFTGFLGFIGIMLPFPISVFLNARTCRAATEPIVRVAAIVGVADIAICMNQMYGSMGYGSRTTLTILATAFATAGRLSVWSGAWPTDARERDALSSPTQVVDPIPNNQP